MTTQNNDRNYSTISPSARALLLMKGLTPIPYARAAAELMMAPEPYIPDYTKTEPGFWGRVAHFEERYQSISALLEELPVTNILELSSGFSFRGLDLVNRKSLHYIDTDLPELIAQKQTFIKELTKDNGQPKGILECLPLNALDEDAFRKIIDRFPPGPVAIVNEGLLMYLDVEEKKKLLGIIHHILVERGGWWITADIYIKQPQGAPSLKLNDKLEHFFEQHHIEDNKFDSYEAAERFFEENGYEIEKERQPDYSQTSTIQYVIKNTTPEQQKKMKAAGRIHATWRMKIK